MSELANRLAVPLTTLHREVVRLADAGLIVSHTQGRNRLVRANTAHPAAHALTRLLEVTFGPKVIIAEEFGTDGAEQVLIFGSERRPIGPLPGWTRCESGHPISGAMDRARRCVGLPDQGIPLRSLRPDP